MNAYRNCYEPPYSSAICLHQQLNATTVTTPSGQRDYQGIIRLSPNGKWGFAIGSQPVGLPPLSLVNIESGQAIDIQTSYGNRGVSGNLVASVGARRAIADDGTAVIAY